MGTLQGVRGPHKWVDKNTRSSKGTGVPQVCWGGWELPVLVERHCGCPLFTAPSSQQGTNPQCLRGRMAPSLTPLPGRTLSSFTPPESSPLQGQPRQLAAQPSRGCRHKAGPPNSTPAGRASPGPSAHPGSPMQSDTPPPEQGVLRYRVSCRDRTGLPNSPSPGSFQKHEHSSLHHLGWGGRCSGTPTAHQVTLARRRCHTTLALPELPLDPRQLSDHRARFSRTGNPPTGTP